MTTYVIQIQAPAEPVNLEKSQREINWLLGHSLETLGISVVRKKIGYVYFFRGSINTKSLLKKRNDFAEGNLIV